MISFEELVKRTEVVNEYWGGQMPLMSCEELSEMIQVISKLERSRKSKSVVCTTQLAIDMSTSRLTAEMADVLICIGALCNRYEIDSNTLAYRIDMKLAKEY